jgi:hypothetical protein
VSHKTYGQLPIKEAEAEPWERLCIDLTGLLPSRRKDQNHCNLVYNNDQSCYRLARDKRNKEAITTANMVEQKWHTRFPISQMLSYDRGTEFMAEFVEMIKRTMLSKEKEPQSKIHKQMQLLK